MVHVVLYLCCLSTYQSPGVSLLRSIRGTCVQTGLLLSPEINSQRPGTGPTALHVGTHVDDVMPVVLDHPSRKWRKGCTGRGPGPAPVAWRMWESSPLTSHEPEQPLPPLAREQPAGGSGPHRRDVHRRGTHLGGGREQQPPLQPQMEKPWAVNFSSEHFIYSMPQASGRANWIKVISFCLFHLKRQHPLGDPGPLIWPLTSLFILLLEFTHVLESAGFFFF